MRKFIWSEFEEKYFNIDMISEVFVRDYTCQDKQIHIVSIYMNNEIENINQFDDEQKAYQFILENFDVV